VARPDGPPRHLDIVHYRLRGAPGVGLVCVLQSDAVDGPTRLVAPLADDLVGTPLNPAVEVGGRRLGVVLRSIAPTPVRLLGAKVASAEPVRADIGRGLDLLFFSI